jgi:hypothetical protein
MTVNSQNEEEILMLSPGSAGIEFSILGSEDSGLGINNSYGSGASKVMVFLHHLTSTG